MSPRREFKVGQRVIFTGCKRSLRTTLNIGQIVTISHAGDGLNCFAVRWGNVNETFVWSDEIRPLSALEQLADSAE